MKNNRAARRSLSDAHGYLTSALVFAAFTALWAVIVRNDPYYRLFEIFGARVPATMIAYLVLMPLAGVVIGRWRYHGRHTGGVAGLVGKLGARMIHFTYAHLLLVLFTVAMATDYFLGLNIDDQIRKVDDRMFDLAARFAPWLAAYLAGFNLGRATRGEEAASGDAKEVRASFADPKLEESAFLANDASDRGDLAADDIEPSALTASGLPSPRDAAGGDQHGFLPPQDLEKLRPRLHELR